MACPFVASGVSSERLNLSEVVDELEDLGGRSTMRCSEPTEPIGDPRAERAELIVVDGLHRGFELTLVSLEGVKLPVDPIVDRLEVIGFVGLEQQQPLGSMVRYPVFGS